MAARQTRKCSSFTLTAHVWYFGDTGFVGKICSPIYQGPVQYKGMQYMAAQHQGSVQYMTHVKGFDPEECGHTP